MSIVFATRHLPSAINFINQMYPDRDDITADDVPLLSELIKQDVLRVQDPDFHRPCQIIAGNNYDKAKHSDSIADAIKEFTQVIDAKQGNPATGVMTGRSVSRKEN